MGHHPRWKPPTCRGRPCVSRNPSVHVGVESICYQTRVSARKRLPYLRRVGPLPTLGGWATAGSGNPREKRSDELIVHGDRRAKPQPHSEAAGLGRGERFEEDDAMSGGLARSQHEPAPRVDDQTDGIVLTGKLGPLPAEGIPSREAKRTRSATDPACIFRMRCPRCSLTVTSLVPNSPAICLLSRPATIPGAPLRRATPLRRGRSAGLAPT